MRLPGSAAASCTERWYVLFVMCLVYALNIAARYVVTTVFEPIRLELRLTDAGAAFLTGVPLALFYVAFGIPIAWLADRSQPAQHRGGLADHLVGASRCSAACRRTTGNCCWAASAWVSARPARRRPPPRSSRIAFPPSAARWRSAVLALGAPIGAWLGADLAGRGRSGFRLARRFLCPRRSRGAARRAGLLDHPRAPARPARCDRRRCASRRCSTSLRFLWRQKAAFHVIMASGVCSLWGWGLAWWTPTFLMRTYGLNVAQAGAITGHIHLVGGMIATAGTAWLMSRPFMVDPRRVLWMLAASSGLRRFLRSSPTGRIRLWIAKLLFWIFIPAIYFYIGPCMALVLNCAPSNMRSMFTAWSVLVGNVFNLIVAPAGRRLPERLVRPRRTRRMPHRCASHCWCWRRPASGRPGISSCGAHGRRRPGTRHRLHDRVALVRCAFDRGDTLGDIDLSCLVLSAAITAYAAAEGVKVLNGDAHYPEGPVWYHGKLYYVEYDRNTVTAWDGKTNAMFWSQKGCGPSAVVPTARGEFLTTCYDNGTIGRIAADGKTLPAYTHDKDGNAFVGPNDFAPDATAASISRLGQLRARSSTARCFTSPPTARSRRRPPTAQRQRHRGLQGRQDPVRGRDRSESPAAVQDRAGRRRCRTGGCS